MPPRLGQDQRGLVAEVAACAAAVFLGHGRAQKPLAPASSRRWRSIMPGMAPGLILRLPLFDQKRLAVSNSIWCSSVIQAAAKL